MTREELARTAREVAEEWHVVLGLPFTPSSHSFVAPAGAATVLKIVSAEDDESTHEADALAFWDGDGAVRLLRHDRERRAMLLERARPGHDASGLAADDALAAAVDVARRLWRRPARDAPYERIADRIPAWLDRAGEGELVRRATEIYASLRTRHDVLVHGDLHHHNLLRHGERWVAIDPKPMLGEREFDVPTLMWNPLGSRPTHAHLERTIAAFAAAGLDAGRIRAWAIVRGTYLGLPLERGEREEDVLQLRVARLLVAGRDLT